MKVRTSALISSPYLPMTDLACSSCAAAYSPLLHLLALYSSPKGTARSGMYGPSLGTMVIQSLIGQTDKHKVHPVQSASTISVMCVSGSIVMDCVAIAVMEKRLLVSGVYKKRSGNGRIRFRFSISKRN